MGLKGNITGEKPSLGKSKGVNQGKGNAGKTSNEISKRSPYTTRPPFISDSNRKRAQSAILSRSQSLGPMTQKANLLNRKSSDPDLGILMPNSSTVQLRSSSASKSHQRRLSTSRASRISTDSDQSSDKNFQIATSQSAVNVTKKDFASKKRRPFSFSSDYKEDLQLGVINPVGDVKGFQVNQIKRQQTLGRFESRTGNHVQFADLKSSSIEMEIAEQPETYLEDKNYACIDKDSSTIKENSPFNNYHGKILSDWKRDYETELKNLSPLKQTLESSQSKPFSAGQQSLVESKSKSTTRDEAMIARTDDLIMEVAKFITQIKSSRAENFPVELNLNDHQDQDSHDQNREDANNSRHFSSSFESVDGLSSITCPSVVYNQSGISTFRDKSGLEDITFSRPSSASLRKSFSNDDIHGRISLTLKLIEQEEKRDRLKKSPMYDHLQDHIEQIQSGRSGSFLPSVSNPPSRPPSRSIPYQASTPRIFYPETSPRLPKINSLIEGSDNQGNLSGRSCSCYSDHFKLNSRSSRNLEPHYCGVPQAHPYSSHEQQYNEEKQYLQEQHGQQQEQNYNKRQASQLNSRELERPKSATDSMWETSHEKTKKIFSFLDEVERSDRETLFGLKYDPPTMANNSEERCFNHEGLPKSGNTSKPNLSELKTMDSLIRKGSVELAREQILLDRKLDESQYRIRVLEETLIQQRELNMRNLRNSEKDLKKRLNLQKEEFDMAFSRNEALINEMAAEKRILQEKCDKVMKNFDENVEKYKDQIKSLQQKHLDEIKRLRKSQLSAENVRKQQWVGNKTQEIREMTVKGLEPEVQRIIQRHQQEMSEVRAWHSDEIRETEERYQRKINMQLQDLREKFAVELEEILAREKESANKKLDSELKQREDEFETQKRRLTNDLYEERERVACEEIKWKDLMQENVRKVQIKGEIQIENLKQECETKITNLERKHENELKSLKDIHEVEKESWVGNYEKKYDQAVKDREAQVVEALRIEMDKEFREREKKVRDEVEKTRKEDEEIAEARNKRIQDKLQADLTEMDKAEKDLKSKFTQAKSELITLEEQVFSLKTCLNLKEKQNNELQESNLKMLEERSNLTSVIRREFTSQIEFLEDEVRSMKSTFVEIETKHKLELEQCQLEIEKVSQDKDVEIDKIGVRVKQAVGRKEETIQELQKQLDKANFQIQHLEGLIEQQRKDFLQSMTSSIVGSKRK